VGTIKEASEGQWQIILCPALTVYLKVCISSSYEEPDRQKLESQMNRNMK
jgi:hypothetical protein